MYVYCYCVLGYLEYRAGTVRVPNGSILQSYDCNELKRLENDSNDFEIASRKRARRVSTSVDRSETSIDSQRSQNQSNFRSDARNKVATRASHSRPTQFLSVFSQSGASGAINAGQQLMMAMARVFAGLGFGVSVWWRALL